MIPNILTQVVFSFPYTSFIAQLVLRHLFFISLYSLDMLFFHFCISVIFVHIIPSTGLPPHICLLQSRLNATCAIKFFFITPTILGGSDLSSH